MKRLISWTIQHIPRKYLQLISPFALKVLAIFYQGNKVECPVCQHTFRKFLPYGRGNSARNNVLCPHCQTLERHRLLWLYLKEKTDFFTASHRLLHIAPEICFIPKFKKIPQLKYVTADLESPLADVKMDIHKMPFENASFDVAICNHVMEHVEDDIQAMKEIYRVLKPGGWAIIQVPFIKEGLQVTFEDKRISTAEDRLKAYGQEDHVRLYGEDYGDRLQSAGFSVKKDDFVFHLDKSLIQRYALPANELIYLCFKL